jgi:hypothetical protein
MNIRDDDQVSAVALVVESDSDADAVNAEGPDLQPEAELEATELTTTFDETPAESDSESALDAETDAGQLDDD